MKLLLEFSGEHAELPEAELHAVLRGERLEYSVEKRFDHRRALLLEVKSENYFFVHRLAFTKDALEVMAVSRSLEDAAAILFKEIEDAESFRVRSDSMIIERRLGDEIHKLGLKVDLRNPDVTVACTSLDGLYHAGIYIHLERTFSLRKPQHRPFFHPTSMQPKLARALVNLAMVNRSNRILDPFCGTGGILIEAGLMGMELVGVDIDKRMVEGCRKNLEHYGLSGDVRLGDALAMHDIYADAIVTDPPYGRASYSSEKTVDALYEGITKKALDILPAGGRMVLTLPEGYSVKEEGLKKVSVFDIKVHRSLTRRVHVLEVE